MRLPPALRFAALRSAALLLVSTGALSAATHAALVDQVRQTETAFAKTMADRNAAAFADFLSSEAIFASDGEVLRGAAQVAARWKAHFQGAQAPFSWKPDMVEVLDSGTLAMTSGPVFDPGGKRVATFHSVWRLEASGRWKIILDNGCPVCNCSQLAAHAKPSE